MSLFGISSGEGKEMRISYARKDGKYFVIKKHYEVWIQRYGIF